jgi:hypothetical protein
MILIPENLWVRSTDAKLMIGEKPGWYLNPSSDLKIQLISE